MVADAFCIPLYTGHKVELLIVGISEADESVHRERATACLGWSGVRGAQFVGDDVWQRHETRLRKKATELVSVYRAALQRVANALMARKTLSGEEVTALMK
jgi:hypothetical protein